MNVLIRSDASNTIGTGHVMRDIVLAKEFAAHSISFATRPLEGNLDALILRAGFQIHSLATNAVAELSQIVRHHAIDLLVIDHYELGYNFEKSLKKEHPSLTLMVVEDTYKKHFCDTLLNHNIYAKKKHYKGLLPKHCEIRCGEKYTLLRGEFLETAEVSKTDSLLIAMGGADTKNMTLKILKLLPKNFSWHVNIITTHANKNLEQLQEYVREKPSVSLHIQTNELAKLAKQARLAIITPSVLANEFYALQTPFIAIQSAQNQKYMRQFLQKKGYDVLKKFSRKKLKILLKGHVS